MSGNAGALNGLFPNTLLDRFFNSTVGLSHSLFDGSIFIQVGSSGGGSGVAVVGTIKTTEKLGYLGVTTTAICGCLCVGLLG